MEMTSTTERTVTVVTATTKIPFYVDETYGGMLTEIILSSTPSAAGIHLRDGW